MSGEPVAVTVAESLTESLWRRAHRSGRPQRHRRTRLANAHPSRSAARWSTSPRHASVRSADRAARPISQSIRPTVGHSATARPSVRILIRPPQRRDPSILQSARISIRLPHH
jgi:hypothetical protein